MEYGINTCMVKWRHDGSLVCWKSLCRTPCNLSLPDPCTILGNSNSGWINWLPSKNALYSLCAFHWNVESNYSKRCLSDFDNSQVTKVINTTKHSFAYSNEGLLMHLWSGSMQYENETGLLKLWHTIHTYPDIEPRHSLQAHSRSSQTPHSLLPRDGSAPVQGRIHTLPPSRKKFEKQFLAALTCSWAAFCTPVQRSWVLHDLVLVVEFWVVTRLCSLSTNWLGYRLAWLACMHNT